nr:hypothetical protein [Tanacetum cinerariifolium]
QKKYRGIATVEVGGGGIRGQERLFGSCKKWQEVTLATAANVIRAKKKKKCRVVCRTHGVSSAHHARSVGVLVFMPTVAPQGLAILLADTATQTETSEDEVSPMLLRSSSLPAMHN